MYRTFVRFSTPHSTLQVETCFPLDTSVENRGDPHGRFASFAPLTPEAWPQTPAPEEVRDERPGSASGAAAEHRGAKRRIATAEARNERETRSEATDCDS